MSYRPLFNRVIIKAPDQPANAAGIELAQSSKERPLQGVVTAVGPDVEFVKVGDTVAYGHFSPLEVEIDGETLWAMKEQDILMVIDHE